MRVKYEKSAQQFHAKTWIQWIIFDTDMETQERGKNRDASMLSVSFFSPLLDYQVSGESAHLQSCFSFYIYV